MLLEIIFYTSIGIVSMASGGGLYALYKKYTTEDDYLKDRIFYDTESMADEEEYDFLE